MRFDDLCHDQGEPQTSHCRRSCGDATTGACDSEGTENIGRINKHSRHIAGGVNVVRVDVDVGAGDQDITFGYSSGEAEDVTPLTHSMSTRLERN